MAPGALKPSPRPVVTLYESVSANGLIARPDDDVGFLTEVIWTDWAAYARAAGAMLWGRRTHELYRSVAARELAGVRGIVLTKDPGFAVEEGWKVATSPEDAVSIAGEAGVRELVVSGGQGVNGAFAASGLLDRFVLDVEAVVVGEGKPLFPPMKPDLCLTLREVKRLTASVVQLHYDVVKG